MVINTIPLRNCQLVAETCSVPPGYFDEFAKYDGFVKSPISALRAIPQNFTYAKYAAFFGIAQALILDFLQVHQICQSRSKDILVQKNAWKRMTGKSAMMENIVCISIFLSAGNKPARPKI